MSKISNTASLALSIILASSTGYAEEAANDATVQLEEIVVTARRRAENLQKIPETVTAFTETAIEDAGIKNVDDFLALTPNFDIRNDQQPGVFTMTVRGVSQVRNGEPPVAFVVDGVTLPSSNSFTQEMFDIQRIEVLKGPQGALYGRNSIGGAIIVVTKQPSSDFEGRVKASAGKGNDYKIMSSVSGPIVEDKALFRLSGYYHNSGGLLENVTLKEKADWEESFGARGKLLLTPSENLSIDVRGSYSNLDAGSAYYVNTSVSFLGNKTGVIQGDHPGVASQNSWDVSAKVDMETNAGTLTSISSYNSLRELNDQEIDWTPVSFLEGQLTTNVDGFTQEVRFTSPSDQKLRWFVGAFYQRITRFRATDAKINLNFLLTGNGNPADKILVPASFTSQNQNFKTYSLFGQANYDITSDLELTVALRWDKDDRKELQVPGNIQKKANFAKLQPRVSLAYKAIKDTLLYVTYARGYRPGGFNSPNSLQNDYRSETLDSYEAGFKSSFAKNSFRLNGDVFYNDFSNQQYFLLETTPGGGLIQVLVNGQASKTYGFELEAMWRPLNGLDFSASVGYTDSKISKFGNIAAFPGGTDRFNGNKLPNTSDLSINLSGQYRFPISQDLDIVSRVDYRLQGRTFWALDNVESEPSYNLVDVRIGIDSGVWRVTGYVKNLFNTKYVTQAFTQEFSGFVSDIAWPSKPVSWGVEADVKF